MAEICEASFICQFSKINMQCVQLNSGSSSFRKKHVTTCFATDKQLVRQAKERFGTKAGARIPASTVIRGKPYFTNGKNYGEEKRSWVPRDVITVDKQGNETKAFMIFVKGKVGPKNLRNGEPNPDAGKVNHYESTSTSDDEVKKSRDEQMEATIYGGIAGALVHVADYHVYKNAKVKETKPEFCEELEGSKDCKYC